jgi:hypothetical protein
MRMRVPPCFGPDRRAVLARPPFLVGKPPAAAIRPLKYRPHKPFVLVDREGDQLSKHEPRKSAALRQAQGERISRWRRISAFRHIRSR